MRKAFRVFCVCVCVCLYNVYGYFAQMFVHLMCAWCWWRPEEGVGFPGTSHTQTGQSSDVGAGIEPVPLKEQPVCP